MKRSLNTYYECKRHYKLRKHYSMTKCIELDNIDTIVKLYNYHVEKYNIIERDLNAQIGGDQQEVAKCSVNMQDGCIAIYDKKYAFILEIYYNKRKWKIFEAGLSCIKKEMIPNCITHVNLHLVGLASQADFNQWLCAAILAGKNA